MGVLRAEDFMRKNFVEVERCFECPACKHPLVLVPESGYVCPDGMNHAKVIPERDMAEILVKFFTTKKEKTKEDFWVIDHAVLAVRAYARFQTKIKNA